MKALPKRIKTKSTSYKLPMLGATALPILTNAQFNLIADLIRSRKQPRMAAYMVLVEGKTNSEAGVITGLSAQSISNTLRRIQVAHKNILEVYMLITEKI